MRIRMLTSAAGPFMSLTRGEEYDIDDDEAIRLINANYAEPVREQISEKAVSQKRSEKSKR